MYSAIYLSTFTILHPNVAMGQNPLPPVNIRIPIPMRTKIDQNGRCTYPKTVPFVLTHTPKATPARAFTSDYVSDLPCCEIFAINAASEESDHQPHGKTENVATESAKQKPCVDGFVAALALALAISCPCSCPFSCCWVGGYSLCRQVGKHPHSSNVVESQRPLRDVTGFLHWFKDTSRSHLLYKRIPEIGPNILRGALCHLNPA